VAGTWVGSWRIDSGKEHKFRSPREREGSLRLSLLQYGSAVTGSATLSLPGNRPGGASCPANASVSGVVAGDQVSLTLSDGGTLQGQVVGDTLSGTYDGACAAPATQLLLHRE
jgi:hypothetical protein